MLAHFKPCSCDQPLITDNANINATFNQYEFDTRSLEIMRNWEEIHECEDKREAERIRKTSSKMKSSKILNESREAITYDSDDDAIHIPLSETHSSIVEAETVNAVLNLCSAGWFAKPEIIPDVNGSSHPMLNEVSSETVKKWMQAAKTQEKRLEQMRINPTNIHSQQDLVPDTIESSEGMYPICSSSNVSSHVPSTESRILSVGHNKDEIVSNVANKYHLNEMQRIAYNIMNNAFFDLLALRNSSNNNSVSLTSPLRMFLTGPGGTGKTHIVKAFKEVMSAFNSSHTIRFLGPTGTAAALIDGTTIHSGLGIKIRKGTHESVSNSFFITTSVRNRTKLHEEWRYVDFVLIDETSMVGAELLFEIDHALRYAKENFDTYFGGVNMIFSGDFYQFPPIGATPLYNPLSHVPKTTTSEISKRLGQLAWKSVNSVIELTEQERMKEDPEYALAVLRLRVRRCIDEDRDIFNSRRIKTADYPSGIDLSEIDESICVIVNKNFIRENINNYKAQAECSKPDSPELLRCYANDKYVDRLQTDVSQMTKKERIYWANLNTSKKTSIGALPGIIPLFVGAPVILRNKNISINLSITNGQPGIIRDVKMKRLDNELFCADLALVEFPASSVHIEGLPKHYYPIFPISSTITSTIPIDNNEYETATIQRNQLPLQLAFAVTAYAAQGKTLPQILCNLKEGGFAAYVSASRARTREGLFITDEVSLKNLNTTISSHLLRETARLDALKYNTLVKFGYSTENICHIPFTDDESSHTDLDITIHYDDPEPRSQTTSSNRKRKR